MPTPTVSSANELVVRVQRGDQQAFADFYDLLAPRVFGVVKRVLRDSAMSEEVSQEIFVELWKSADKFDSERGNACAWALTIARRRAVDRVRSEQSQRNRINDLAAQRHDEVDQPDDHVVSSIEVSRLRDAVAQLPADQREVITLSFIEGRAHGEIADMLDIPLGTVKGRVRGGLKRLRGRLGDAS